VYILVETVHHLFFECEVAKVIWRTISGIFSTNIGLDFESIARWWIRRITIRCLTFFLSAVLWTLWSTHNDLCFQGKSWQGPRCHGDAPKIIVEDQELAPSVLGQKLQLTRLQSAAAGTLLGELLRIAWT
jgi:hypothetical protein